MPATVEVITNKGPDSLLRVLKDLLKGADRADFAVAFATETGVGQVLRRLYEIARRGHARVLTGLYEHETEPGALRLLLRAQEDTRGRMSVRIAGHEKFHAKLYLIRKRETLYAIVGSSNLTEAGLLSGGERNVLLRLPVNSAEGRRLIRLFDAEWDNRQAKPIGWSFIRLYERNRRPARRPPRRRSVASLLGEIRTNERALSSEVDEPTYWRTSISGYAARVTEDVIAQETDWQQKGYFWFSSWGKILDAREGDRLLIFDLTRGLEAMFAAELVDKLPRTSRPTPDGRSFLAVHPLKRLPERRLTPRRWSMLAGHERLLRNRRAARQSRRLKPHQWEHFLSVLRRQ